MNLFEFDVNAVHLNDPFAESGWYGVGLYNESTTPVPADDIYIGTLGQASGDPVLYAALPNKINVDATVLVPSDDHVAFNENSPIKRALTITANGSPLAPDTVATNATFCVGQSITFAAVWDSPPPAIATNFQWSCEAIISTINPMPFPAARFPIHPRFLSLTPVC